MKSKKGQNSDYDADNGSIGRQMRIASSGRIAAASDDKEVPSRSDHNELASIEDRSFDPDNEPRKEGLIMKHSPSVAEILPNIDGLSDGASMGNERSLKRGSQTRSPGKVNL